MNPQPSSALLQFLPAHADKASNAVLQRQHKAARQPPQPQTQVASNKQAATDAHKDGEALIRLKKKDVPQP